jgi:hypothetical protein
VGLADIGDAKAPSRRDWADRNWPSASSACSGISRGSTPGDVGRGARDRAVKAWQADVFGGSIVRSLPNEFDKSGNGNRLAVCTRRHPK